MAVISAVQRRFGALATNCRCTRSGAGLAGRRTLGGDDEPAAMAAYQPGNPHQPGHALATTAYPGRAQVGMDPWCPIGPPTLLVRGADAGQQRRVRLGAGRGSACAPCVVAAGGDAQHATEHGDRMMGLLSLHERKPHSGVCPVSWAKKAAAFKRISRSSRSRLTSRRNWRTSSVSWVVRPSWRRPVVDVSLPHPQAQRLRADLQPAGDLGRRPAAAANQPDGLAHELGGIGGDDSWAR